MGEAVPDPDDLAAFPAWARSVADCEARLGVSVTRGLSSAEAAARLRAHGPNELADHPAPSLLRLLLDQFEDTLVRVLLAAAAVSFLLALSSSAGALTLAAFVEPLVIFLILVVNAAVGVWQEANAERALDALREIQSHHAAVLRDAAWLPALPARDLVPGDVVQLRVGDKVPADMRVASLLTSTLRLEQGSLTGETASVNKTSRALPLEDADIQAKDCMVFAGTTVVNGAALCIVARTGMDTEIGAIHAQIHQASQEDDDTPLKKKLNEFGEALTKIIGLICALVWLINVKYFLTFDLQGGWVPRNITFSFEKCTYYFEIAVALAVAAIPEGLPAVITTCLALGTRKMAAKNALVRKLPSVETLGCTTVICSDKTGTLTTNKMSVAKLVAVGDSSQEVRTFKVDGTTYDPRDGKIHDWPAGSIDANLETIAKVAAVCNDANVAHSSHQYVATGMPTEAALKVKITKTYTCYYSTIFTISEYLLVI
jgi:P-type Ca2+ transporter type 2C